MRVAWGQLLGRYPDLPPELYEQAEATPAMLQMLAQDWLAQGANGDVFESSARFAHEKLRLEVRWPYAWGKALG